MNYIQCRSEKGSERETDKCKVEDGATKRWERKPEREKKEGVERE